MIILAEVTYKVTDESALTPEEVIEAWKELPISGDFVESPEMIQAMVDLLVVLHGETLKELENH